MIHTIWPIKDTTIYEDAARDEYNYGLDEILEIQKYVSSSTVDGIKNSRILINFTASDVYDSSHPVNAAYGDPVIFTLTLYSANEYENTNEYDLLIGRGDDFVNGSGKLTRNPGISDGASWNYSDGAATNWRQNWDDLTPTDAEVTESGDAVDQYVEITKSPLSNDYSPDIFTRVTKIVSRSIANHTGSIQLAVTRTPAQESNGTSYGSLAFFSNETKTIFKPRIHAQYADYTSSGAPTSTVAADKRQIITTKHHKYNIQWDSLSRIYFIANEPNPLETYSTSSLNTTTNAISKQGLSYYQIRDVLSNTVYHALSETYSRLSNDTDSHWLNIYANSFIPGREYTIDIRTDDREYPGSIEWYSDVTRFKVSRNKSDGVY